MTRLDWEVLRQSYGTSESDQPAMLSWKVDEDGAVHMAPLTLDDVSYWASRSLEIELQGVPFEADDEC